MRKFLLFTTIAALVALTATTVYAAPPDEPPGLKRAIAAQEAHTDSLLTIPGVVGTAVGLQSDGAPVVKIYTEKANVAGLPKKLDGIPVVVQVTGKIVALAKPAPVASFKISNCSDHTVNFDASASSGTRLTYNWNFGDGNTGSGEFPSHPYAEGTYTVTLTVTDKFGVASGPASLDVTVPCEAVNQPPVASFTYGIVDLTCNFDGSGSHDPDGYITTWGWDFGDGNTDSGATVSHTYPAAGIYTVTLTVTDNESAIDTNTQEVSVVIQEGRYHRPAYIGTSSGSENLIDIDGGWYCTVGTLGVRLTDGNNYYALSNNHVYALQGEKVVWGDNQILQPGRVDMTEQACGSDAEIEDAVIGTLTYYVPITFSTSDNTNNKVDAAVALTTPEMVGQSTPPDTGYGIPSSEPVSAAIGMRVQKHGRTTDLTSGRITGINVTILVDYDGKTARFVDQIEVFGPRFSAGGDSGSLIVTSTGLNPVALLFAGGGAYTFGNPINEVLSKLSYELHTTLWIDGS